MHKILTISHAHPHFSLGGGEIAAYNLYKAYSQLQVVKESMFLASISRHGGKEGLIYRKSPNEYLWNYAAPDYTFMSTGYKDSILSDFTDLLLTLKPTLIHCHHYWPFGLEIFPRIKKLLPNSKTILTLHEMQAICLNNGQMIRKDTNSLCFRETAEGCHQCFPEISKQQFWLRKHRYHSMFDHIDYFVSPSSFLKQRYSDWGIDNHRITVIENGQDPSDSAPPRALLTGQTRSVYGFFGQINPYKGVDVLLKALHAVNPKENPVKVFIYGANLEKQPLSFRETIDSLSRPLVSNGILTMQGPYHPFQVKELMSNVDWVVVPSIWWENSPMVIQEAFNYGRPVIASNIGGMSEKVKHNVNGILVNAGSPLDLANVFEQTCHYTDRWDQLVQNIKKPLSYLDCAYDHLSLVA